MNNHLHTMNDGSDRRVAGKRPLGVTRSSAWTVSMEQGGLARSLSDILLMKTSSLILSVLALALIATGVQGQVANSPSTAE